MKNRYSWSKHFDFFVLDVISWFLSFLISFYIRHRNLSLFQERIYVLFLFVYIISDLFIYFLLNPYDNVLRNGYLVELKNTILNSVLITLASTAFLFIFKIGNEFSRITLFLTSVIYVLISYVLRLIWKKHIREKAVETVKNGDKSLLIICKFKEAEVIINNIKKNNYDYYQISGLCIVDKKMIGETIDECEVVASKENLLDYVSSKWIDDIFISSYNLIPKAIMKELSLTGIPIHIKIDEIKDLNDRVQIIENFSSYNTIGVVRREYSFFEPLIKRLMDIIGGLIGCLFTLLLIVVIGPMIYVKSPGPIIYVSDRVGKNGKVFKFYKFRSMVLNADDLKDSLKKQNRVKDGMMFKIENDPRIIPGIGSFIRKTSLDEFPQFFNVLKGDMSLVGTRPPTVDEWQKYSPYYRSRLSIKPGITGLWQISGRSEITDFDEVVRLDNEYINNWSIDLDLKILFKTVFYMFKGDKGAM